MSLLDERLDKNVPIPLYFQLKNLILSDIRAGLIPAGETIPTEQQLSEHFQISRSTVRQAISELTREGWLTRRASKGTFVTEPHQTAHYIHSFEPFYQQVERQNRKPSTELLGLEVLTATPELAEKLEAVGTSHGSVALVVGSSYGLSPAVKSACDFRLSVSKLTFPHQLMRVILMETLYRSLGILRGTKYHK